MNDIPLDQYTLARYEHLSVDRRHLADILISAILDVLVNADERPLTLTENSS
jgi:hypothetical protein